jgi:hypothetical protein
MSGGQGLEGGVGEARGPVLERAGCVRTSCRHRWVMQQRHPFRLQFCQTIVESVPVVSVNRKRSR